MRILTLFANSIYNRKKQLQKYEFNEGNVTSFNVSDITNCSLGEMISKDFDNNKFVAYFNHKDKAKRIVSNVHIWMTLNCENKTEVHSSFLTFFYSKEKKNVFGQEMHLRLEVENIPPKMLYWNYSLTLVKNQRSIVSIEEDENINCNQSKCANEYINIILSHLMAGDYQSPQDLKNSLIIFRKNIKCNQPKPVPKANTTLNNNNTKIVGTPRPTINRVRKAPTVNVK